MSASTITDEQILAKYNGELDVWSVGITLPDGTYVGFGCATEVEVPRAKEQVRARCTELFNARTLRLTDLQQQLLTAVESLTPQQAEQLTCPLSEQQKEILQEILQQQLMQQELLKALLGWLGEP